MTQLSSGVLADSARLFFLVFECYLIVSCQPRTATSSFSWNSVVLWWRKHSLCGPYIILSCITVAWGQKPPTNSHQYSWWEIRLFRVWHGQALVYSDIEWYRLTIADLLSKKWSNHETLLTLSEMVKIVHTILSKWRLNSQDGCDSPAGESHESGCCSADRGVTTSEMIRGSLWLSFSSGFNAYIHSSFSSRD